MVRAYAKLNLTLEVLGRRADGYHELASVMQTIALHDTLVLRVAPAGARTLVCDVPELAGDDNLALRAAHALARASADPAALGVLLELRKEIPAQAGLGGGSSDGACALIALNAYWNLRFPPNELSSMAAALGSDVPFFVAGGTALVRGRGEQVTALPDVEPLWLVVVKPPVSVPTPAAFRALTDADFSTGSATESTAQTIRASGHVPLTGLVNDFETSVMRDYPAVAAARRALLDAGAPVVRLSGSGPTLFAPFSALAPAANVYQRIHSEGHLCWLTHTVSRAECGDRDNPRARH